MTRDDVLGDWLVCDEYECYASQIFSQESQTIVDYENMNLVRKVKAAKILKSLFSTMDFPQIWCTRLSF